MRLISLFTICILFSACGANKTESKAALNTATKTSDTKKKDYMIVGQIERLDDRINQIIPPDAKIERIATGLTWAEGPLWVDSENMLLCSDVKTDKIYKWTEKDGMSVYIEPSGFTGETTDSREKGSNGLTLNHKGELIMCQHGNRQIARMDATLKNPASKFVSIVDNYEGKKFNSPNDLIYDSKGNLYFTDPPFGLSEAMLEDPKKEIDFQGIYKYTTQGELILMTSEVSRPNGLALSKDESKMYVANTDETQAQWLEFTVGDNTLTDRTIIHDATHLIGKEEGFPDGVKVDAQGNIFSAGPGGIWVFGKDHTLLGKIKSGYWSSNCNFNADYSTLYITADDHLLRLKLK